MSLKAILDRLVATPGVTAIVASRIFAEVAPQGEPLPYIVLRQSGSGRGYTLDGPGGPGETRVVIQAFATSFAVADRLADAIEAAFSAPFSDVGPRAFLDGVNISDFVEARQAFRRAIEVRWVR